MSDRTHAAGRKPQRARGRQAIRQHEFDVLLVDLNLGDGEAFEVLEFFKSPPAYGAGRGDFGDGKRRAGAARV